MSTSTVSRGRPTTRNRRLTPRPLAALTAALLLLQTAWGLALPSVAVAAPTTVVWTTQADFESNASTTAEPTTRNGVDTVTSPGDVQLRQGPVMVAQGDFHVIGIRADGSVVATGGAFFGEAKLDTGAWANVVGVDGGYSHSVGVTSDGHVLAVGDIEGGVDPSHLDVAGWSNVETVTAGWGHTLGLRSDGTAVATGVNQGYSYDVSGWTGLNDIASGRYHMVGLRSDGSVVATGRGSEGQLGVTGWTDIVGVAAGGYHTVGLKADGTVVGVGSSASGELEVAGWTNIVAVAAGGRHTLGLKADGTVVATGSSVGTDIIVAGWERVAAIATGWSSAVGLTADGEVLITGPEVVVGGAAEMLAGSVMTGTMGSGAGAVGLRADLGTVGDAMTLQADFDTMREGEAVKFGIRLSYDGVTWGPTLGSDGLPVDWTSGTGTYFGQAFEDGAARTDLSALPSARHVEIVVRLEGLAGTSPVLHEVAFSYDTDVADTFTVTFEANGGTPAPGPQEVAAGGTVTEPADPTREGYTFGGWFADAECTIPWDFATDTVTGDTTLYASWTINSYDVTFESNGGSSVTAQVVEHGGLASVPAPDPTREGYTFGGWFADPALTDPWDFATDTVTGDTTLYALWIRDPIEFIRHAGADRYETALLAAVRDFPDGAPIAIVATGENFPDALAAAGLAGTVEAPIILTRTAMLSPECARALEVLKTEKVYIAGGPVAVSPAVEAELAKSYQIERLPGIDRYETARLIALEATGLGASRSEVFLAYGGNFADALAVSSIAVQERIPVLLTRTDVLHPDSAAIISTFRVDTVYIAGGHLVVSEGVVSQVGALGADVVRWAGEDRYKTAASVIQNGIATWDLEMAEIGLATGVRFPDALAGGAAMGHQDGLLLLTRTESLSPEVEPIILAAKPTVRRVEFFGGLMAISQAVEDRVRELLLR